MRASARKTLFFSSQFLQVLVDADNVGQEVVETVFGEDAALEAAWHKAGFVGFEILPPGTAFQVIRETVDISFLSCNAFA